MTREKRPQEARIRNSVGFDRFVSCRDDCGIALIIIRAHSTNGLQLSVSASLGIALCLTNGGDLATTSEWQTRR